MNILLPEQLEDRFARVCRHILENPAANHRLSRLAEIACLSSFHFLRRFKQALRETPHHFVTRVRIDRAKDLLSGTEYSVTEISLIVGFESMGSFSRIFHAATGWSPSIYRSRCWSMAAQPARFIPACYRHQFKLATGPGLSREIPTK